MYGYNVMEMNEQVLGLPFTPPEILSRPDDNDYLHEMAMTPSKMELLSNKDCIDAYAQEFQVTRGNVVLVVERNFTSVPSNDREAWRQMVKLRFSSGYGSYVLGPFA
jgi:hypothetical protein